jgi:6-phosphogluconolactonase (cycloisomerase 2 family)
MEEMDNERTLKTGISRRTFLASTGKVVCASVGGAALLRTGMAATPSADFGSNRAILYAAVYSRSSGSAIHSFLTPCGGAAAMAMHPSLPILYTAADALPGQPLPHGHVEAFHIDVDNEHGRFAARVAMSLAATGPRSLAVSSDGAFLIVSAYDGGIWNAFPLDGAGMPAPVPVARKELGTGSDHPAHFAAHPHSVVAIPHTRFAIVTDTGSNQLAVLAPESGKLSVLMRCRTASVGGPGHVALCRNGQDFCVADLLSPYLSFWRIDASGGTPALEHAAAQGLPTRITAMVAHASAPIVLTARPAGGGSRLDTWARNRLSQSRLLPFSSARAMVCHGGTLWAATSEGLLRISLDHEGRVQQASLHARVSGLTALTLQQARVS